MSKQKKPLDLDNLDLDAEMALLEESITRSMQEHDDPLAAVEYTGDAEVDSKAELTELQQAFRERKKNEARRFELATDSEYWVALCFQTRAQKETFLKALKLIQYGDKYLDGRLLAEKMGITLTEEEMPYNTSAKVDKKLSTLAGGY